MFCTKCGKEVDANATTCPECGESLAKKAEPKKVKGQVGIIVMLVLTVVAAISYFSMASLGFWTLLLGGVAFVVGTYLKKDVVAKYVRVGGLGVIALGVLIAAFNFFSILAAGIQYVLLLVAHLLLILVCVSGILTEFLPKQKIFGTLAKLGHVFGVIAAVVSVLLLFAYLAMELAGADPNNINTEALGQVMANYLWMLLYYIFAFSLVGRMAKYERAICQE